MAIAAIGGIKSCGNDSEPSGPPGDGGNIPGQVPPEPQPPEAPPIGGPAPEDCDITIPSELDYNVKQAVHGIIKAPETQTKLEFADDLALMDRARRIARNNDVTLIDAKPHIEMLDEADTAEDVLVIMSDYAEEHGIKFGLVTGEEGSGVVQLAQEDIDAVDLKALRTTARRFIASLSIIPKELSEYVGITEIKIAKDLGDERNPIDGVVPILGKVDGETLYYRFDVFREFAPEALTHEYAGIAMDKLCEGRDQDPAWESLNPAGTKYGEKPLVKEVFVYERGAASLEDDRNTVAEATLAGLDERTTERSSPAQAKAVELVNRLGTVIPGLPQFLVELTDLQAQQERHNKATDKGSYLEGGQLPDIKGKVDDPKPDKKKEKRDSE